MSISDSLYDILLEILTDYFDTFSIEQPTIPEYRIVDDIAKEYLALRPDVLKKSYATEDSLNKYNGFAIPPQEASDGFTVLINKNILIEALNENRMDWVGTIAHETTHVQDYAQYARILGTEEYNEILSIDKHGMFNLWTEINARAKGYYFTRKYTVGEENLQCDELLPDILNREIPLQSERLFQQYHATTNGFEQAYLVAQYIGRLYTLHILYPNQFTDEWIKQHFGVNSWMTDWYLFYKEYNTLESAVLHFEKMKDILLHNFVVI